MTKRKQKMVSVMLPDQKQWRIPAGPGSLISKAVIEEFAPRFLLQPEVVLLSDSRSKPVGESDALLQDYGLSIPTDWPLPDVILAELAPVDPALVFVDVVAAGGPISEGRRIGLLRLAGIAGYRPQQVAFVSAFMDRGGGDFRRVCSEISWATFVWFAMDPDKILAFFGKQEPRRLCDMPRRGARRERRID